MALKQIYIKNVGPAKIQNVQQKITGCWTYVQQNENKFQKVWLPYTSFCSIYVKAINIYRQFTLYKNICYHYTNEIDLIVPSLFVMTARPQCALWSRAANSFLARYAGGLYEFLFEAYLRIKFWKFSNSDVLLKLNIYKILLYDAYHIYGIKRLVRSQPSPIPSSFSNETMPNAEQFMLTLSEHQTIQSVLVGGYMARALVLVVFVYFLSILLQMY